MGVSMAVAWRCIGIEGITGVAVKRTEWMGTKARRGTRKGTRRVGSESGADRHGLEGVKGLNK